MIRILYITSFALATISAVSGSYIRVPRKQAPSNWDGDFLEDYTTYHNRYLSLGCEDKHNTNFFRMCCHPHLKNQAADSVPSECAQSAQPSPSPNDDCVDDDHDGGPQGTPSTTLPFSSEIPPPSATPAQTTPSPEAFRHAEAAAPPVVTPTTTTTSSHVPPMTTPSPSPAATTPLPSPATTTPLPSPATTPSSPSTAPTNVDDFSGQGTFFYQNGVAGACGQVHSDSDFICAMDQARYGDSGGRSPLCGQQVQITNEDNGKSVTVTIADDCPTCANANSIDLSVAAFDALANPVQGVINIRWHFV